MIFQLFTIYIQQKGRKNQATKNILVVYISIECLTNLAVSRYNFKLYRQNLKVSNNYLYLFTKQTPYKLFCTASYHTFMHPSRNKGLKIFCD